MFVLSYNGVVNILNKSFSGIVFTNNNNFVTTWENTCLSCIVVYTKVRKNVDYWKNIRLDGGMWCCRISAAMRRLIYDIINLKTMLKMIQYPKGRINYLTTIKRLKWYYDRCLSFLLEMSYLETTLWKYKNGIYINEDYDSTNVY